MDILKRRTLRRRVEHYALTATGLLAIATIILLDITTGVWNDLVILSGLAAGLVSFLLTVLVLDRVMARSTARRWAPVNRLALSEFLHAIADEDRSEISRGRIVPRTLPLLELSESAASIVTIDAASADLPGESDGSIVSGTSGFTPMPDALGTSLLPGSSARGAAAVNIANGTQLHEQGEVLHEQGNALHELREQIVFEREKLTEPLSRWAQFLASSGDNETILRHIADIAMQLDQVRDLTLEVESAHDASSRDARIGELNEQTRGCNASMLALEAELTQSLRDDAKLSDE